MKNSQKETRFLRKAPAVYVKDMDSLESAAFD